MKHLLFFPLLAALALAACGKSEPSSAIDPKTAPAQVRDAGLQIVFGEQSPQLRQISVDTVRCSTINVGVTAPAHVAVSIVPSSTGGTPLFLFDSQETTQLYAEFVKSGAAIEPTTKQLERVRALYAHKIVPQKDVLDAENEHAQVEADRGQLESRLRSSGIDPAALRSAAPGTVWVIADVPETQLSLMHRGGSVKLTCNSFPGQSFTGTIAAIGDVIDPGTRTVKVRVALHSDGALRPGMYATATFDERSANAVSVPRTALVNVQGRSYVFACTAPGVFRRTEVSIGAETPEAYLIATGVTADQQVASAGVMLLKGLSFGY